MKNLLQNIKMVFRYWWNIKCLILKDLFSFSLLKEKIVGGILLILYPVFIFLSKKGIDIWFEIQNSPGYAEWLRYILAVVFITFLYGIILIFYYPAKIDRDKQKKIDDLSPLDIPFEFSGSRYVYQVDPIKLNVLVSKDRNTSDILCTARFEYLICRDKDGNEYDVLKEVNPNKINLTWDDGLLDEKIIQSDGSIKIAEWVYPFEYLNFVFGRSPAKASWHQGIYKFKIILSGKCNVDNIIKNVYSEYEGYFRFEQYIKDVDEGTFGMDGNMQFDIESEIPIPIAPAGVLESV